MVKVEAIETALSLMTRLCGLQRYQRVQAIFDIRKSWQESQGTPLLDILVQTKDSLCGRRHDRVFGLLGLALDDLDYLSEPNYDADLDDLSISMTRSYIERRSIDIILLASHHDDTSTLPSWCPDWFRFDKQPIDSRIYDQLVQRRSQNLSERFPNGWYATGSTYAAVQLSGKTLRTSARYLGTICSLGWCLLDPDVHEFPQHDRTWAERCRHLDVTNVMYQAMLAERYWYNEPLINRFKRARQPWETIRGYSWVYVFLEKLGRYDPESHMSDFAR